MIVAFYHHPAPSAPLDYDYDAMAQRLIVNCLDMGYTPVHLCLEGGPDYGCERRVFKGNPNQIMLERMKAYCRMARTDPCLWFVDTDIVIQKPLPEMDCDIGLTWRPQKILGSHYNGGVIYSGPKGNDFFLRCLGEYPMNGDAWGGDQFALTEVVGDLPPRDHEIFGMKLTVLPCDPFNYSPTEGEDTSDKVIVHYKGDRKKFMEVA